MKTTINGFITFRPARYQGDVEYYLQPCEMDDYGYITVMPFSIEVEIPDDFDPRAKQIELLRTKEQEVRAEFAKRITDIQREISKLTAIESSAEAGEVAA